ncbi:MAG: hypothetical protein STHCBS139747_007749 [Sporothrix thermara]
MSRDTQSQTPQQSVAKGPNEQTSHAPEQGSNSNSNSTSTSTGTTAAATTKKGHSLLHVPSRSPSQKNQSSPTSTGLSGATASESRDSIGRQSRESKTSFLGGGSRHHPNGSVSSKHSGNITGPTNTPGTSQPSSPAVATNAQKAQRKKGGGGGFLALFGCCTVPDDANGLDEDVEQPLPANKLKDIPPRQTTASRRTGTPNDEISTVSGAAAGGRSQPSQTQQQQQQQLNEKADNRQGTTVDESLVHTTQPEQQYMPTAAEVAAAAAATTAAAAEAAAEAAGETTGATASSSKEKWNSASTTVQDQSTSTTASTAVAGTSSTFDDADSKQAPTVTVEAPVQRTSDGELAEEDADAAQTSTLAGEEGEAQEGAAGDAEMADASVRTTSVTYARPTHDVLPNNIPPPPPGPAPTGALPQVENGQNAVSAELVDAQQQPKALLPPIDPRLKGRKCLVLDLDETLVHSSFKILHQADFTIPVEIEGNYHNIYVIKRPGVDEFMKRVGELYEVVVFTASVSKYGNPLLDQLDIHNVVHHRLFRESCFNHQGNYVKDLSMVGRDLKDTIIIDNSPTSYIFHPQHAVPISSWFSDAHDNELLDLIPVLEDLAGPTVQDVSMVLDVTL